MLHCSKCSMRTLAPVLAPSRTSARPATTLRPAKLQSTLRLHRQFEGRNRHHTASKRAAKVGTGEVQVDSAEAEDLEAAEAVSTSEEPADDAPATTSSSSNGAAVASLEEAVQQAEEALKNGSFDPSMLEGLLPDAMKEVDGLVGRAEIAEAAAKAANDKYLRLNADFDNYRKRTAAEKDQVADRARGDAIKALIPLVDSFEAAQKSVKAETENEIKISTAYQGLYKQLVEAFKTLGVEAVPGVGEPFDPEFHEAIMREPSSDQPDGTVLQEFRRGFRLNKTLLRPSMVKVSFNDDTAAPASQDASEDVVVEVEGA